MPGASWDDLDAIAVTYGPGLAGSLLVGINFAKALAWVHDKPLVGVNHLEGHVYAGWLLDPGEDDAARQEPIFPLVALVVSGGHTFLAEMRDHLTYRLLGTTVDDAAGEAFDKVGRLLGLGYPGGPAIQRAAEGATRKDIRFPRAWMGDSYDWSFSGLKTAARKIVAEARAGRGPAGGRPRRPSVRGVRRRAGVGLPGRRRRRPGHEDRAGGTGGGRTLDHPRRRRGSQQRAARAPARRGRRAGHPPRRPAARPVHRQRGDDRGGRRAPLRGRRTGSPGPRRPPVAAAGKAMTGSEPPAAPTAARVDPADVRATLKAAGLRARHALSQNFLADADVLSAILAEAGTLPGDRVLEIGPGLGLLTGGLLDGGATVTAVELDRRLAAFLRDQFIEPLEAGRLTPRRGRCARPGPRPPRRAALRRRGQPAVPHHLADPPCAARDAAPATPARAHGPARGRRPDRGPARAR